MPKKCWLISVIFCEQFWRSMTTLWSPQTLAKSLLTLQPPNKMLRTPQGHLRDPSKTFFRDGYLVLSPLLPILSSSRFAVCTVSSFTSFLFSYDVLPFLYNVCLCLLGLSLRWDWHFRCPSKPTQHVELAKLQPLPTPLITPVPVSYVTAYVKPSTANSSYC